MHEAISPSPAPASGNAATESGESPHSRRNGLFCALLFAACLAAAYPVAEMGFIDDWSYIKTALDFAHTGRFVFNGWATAMLGWQVVWGALFIKLFGFSCTIVRLSTWVVAVATVYLFHQILRRFGITPWNAVFGALTLGLSPLFIPLAASYMTDVTGLFVILIALYMCQRAVAAKSDRAALLWLCSAALINVAGGTVRQIAWLGALVMVPSTAWLLRRRRGMISAGLLMWVASIIGVLGCMHWFHQQPYSVSEQQIVGVPIHAAMFAHLMVLLLKTLLCLLLVLLPVLAAWLPAARRLSFRARARIAVFMIALTALSILMGFRGSLEGKIMPWIIHVIGSLGIGSGDMLGSKPVTLGVWPRLVVSLIVVAAGLAFVEQMLDKTGSRETPSPKRKQSSWREADWLLGPFVLSYLVLLLPRGIHGLIFDRYLLAPMAVAIVVLLKLHQQQLAVKLPPICWLVLAVFALYTVAATHDWFAMDRAIVLAADEIQASGAPRTAIEGGLEYDGWTQIENGGHVNVPFIGVPKGTYNANVRPLPLPPACQLWFSIWMPAVMPKYFLTFGGVDCLAPSTYPAVGYRGWLPPFHREIFVQQSPDSPK